MGGELAGGALGGQWPQGLLELGQGGEQEAELLVDGRGDQVAVRTDGQQGLGGIGAEPLGAPTPAAAGTLASSKPLPTKDTAPRGTISGRCTPPQVGNADHVPMRRKPWRTDALSHRRRVHPQCAHIHKVISRWSIKHCNSDLSGRSRRPSQPPRGGTPTRRQAKVHRQTLKSVQTPGA